MLTTDDDIVAGKADFQKADLMGMWVPMGSMFSVIEVLLPQVAAVGFATGGMT